MYNEGFSVTDISNDVRVTVRGVNKIINHYAHHGTLIPFSRGGGEADVVTDDVLHCIEIWKLQRPSIYAREIQNRLLLEGICDRDELPSISAINQSLGGKLGMTRKKLTSVPKEYMDNSEKVDEYLEITSRINPSSMHFFDEASVVKTTPNRQYGSSYSGSQAIEIQRYTSLMFVANFEMKQSYCYCFSVSLFEVSSLQGATESPKSQFSAKISEIYSGCD